MLDKYVSLTVSFLLLFFVCAFYYPYIGGGFVFDDIPNLTPLGQIASDGEKFWQVVLSNNSGPTGRPVSMFFFCPAIFRLAYKSLCFPVRECFYPCLQYVAGVSSLWLFVGRRASIWTVCQQKSDSLIFSHGVTFLGFSSGNVSSVLYVVQRMNLLSVFLG